MTDGTQSFRQWLKWLRAARDLTQDALAAQVGSAGQTIRMIESGKRRPSRQMAERLADVLQVPPAERADFVRLARLPVDAAPEAAPAPAPPPAPPALSMPLMATKLYVPRPRSGLTARPRLIERLDAGLAGPLTLIAAPAGWGKTTLLADWLSHGLHGRRAAWLTLEPGDGDPGLFLRYLVAALQRIAPEVGTTLAPYLGAAQSPSLETLLPLLVNELAALAAPSILVLDDYHVIHSAPVHQAVTFLLEHLPPQLHLVLATRADPPLPLPRFRARGLLSELRASDLRFSTDEAGSFLAAAAGAGFTAAEVAAIAVRTEGWIAGIQLAALSLREQPPGQRARFIDAFTGSHRFVVDYLVDEVLSRQPPQIQRFLLQTAILERLCGPLCDAVVGADVEGGASQQLIEELERANLFIVPLDDDRRWYRYHHLFGQVLRERLSRGADVEPFATLHLRASSWFEQAALPAEAVQHALAARDWERASALIVTHGRVLLVNGQAHTVLGWIDALPADVLQLLPYLLHLRALGLFFTSQFRDAERALELVEAALSAGPVDDRARALKAYVRLLQATIARFRGDAIGCVPLAEEALATLPADDLPRRTSARLILLSAAVARGDLTARLEHGLVDALAVARTVGDKSSLLNGVVNLAALQRRQGRLAEAVATFREAEVIAATPGGLQTLGNGAAYFFGLGDLVREQNDLTAAQRLLSQGRELVVGGLIAEADSIVAGYGGLVRLQLAQGDVAGAHGALDELGRVAQERTFAARPLAGIDALHADLAVRSGDLNRAVRWAETIAPAITQVSSEQVDELVILVRVRLAQGRADPAGPALRAALALIAQLLPLAAAHTQTERRIELSVLQALGAHALDDKRGAFAALERALGVAAPAGYVRIIVDEGAPMAALLATAVADPAWGQLAAMPGHTIRGSARRLLELLAPVVELPPLRPGVLVGGMEPLTPRELDVLRCLAAGRSTAEIAQELIVAAGTVKRHVNNILSKLQARSRLEAVARAKELQLL